MACIKELNNAITYDCKGGTVNVAELYLINRSQISAYTVDATGTIINTVTLTTGAKTVPVECYKAGVKVIEALKAGDARAGVDQSLTFLLYNKGANSQAIIKALLSGSFMAAVRFADLNADKIMLGVVSGLEISQLDTDSSANGGFTTVTVKTPDDAAGESRMKLADAAWDTIVNAKLV